MVRAALPAILLVTVGAAAAPSASTGAFVLHAFGETVGTAFPGHALAWAFTASHAGKQPLFHSERGLPVAEALTRLAGENHTRIAVQPLHLVDGIEHAALRRAIETWRQTNAGITVSVGAPLLTDEASMLAALDAMRLAGPPFPGEVPDPEEAVIWVGHGSEPPHDAAYRQLAVLAAGQTPRQYVGCLTGCCRAGETIPALAAAGWKKACLMPLFTLAGRHAASDLGGDGPDSWKSRLSQAGIRSRVLMRGMLEHEAFAAMWTGRLREALQNL